MVKHISPFVCAFLITAFLPGRVQANLGESSKVEFSHTRGFYDEPFSLTIATETEDAIIFYTLDGSNPYGDGLRGAVAGVVYRGPIPITTTTTVRAVAVKAGVASAVETQTYIFLDDIIRQTGAGFPNTWGHAGADYEMDPQVINNSAYRDSIKNDLKAVPTMSLVMGTADWFDSTSNPAVGGIYAHPSWEDTAGDLAERAVSVEYFDPHTSEQFQIDAGVRLAGGTSTSPWKMDKLSMRLKFMSRYGPAKLKFPVFGDDATDEFDTLVLDARMNNSWAYGGGVGISRPGLGQRDVAQYTRDQFVSDIQNAMGGYGTHGRHVHLYLNGLYWGLYWLHERPDEHFAASYFGGRDDDYDVLKHTSGTVVSGSASAYNAMISLANAGLRSDEQYQSMQQLVDIPNLIDYMITNYYVGNTDWAMHNWYATCNRAEADGRWRYHSWDAEHVMEGLSDNATGRNDAGGPTGLHRRLMDNAEYRMLFADHVHRHLFNDGVLTPAGAAALYQVRLDDVDRAVVGESARWGDNHRFTPYTRDVEWVRERNWLLNTYFPQRTSIVLNQLKSRGWYPSVEAPAFHLNSSYLHGRPISTRDPVSMTSPTGTIWYTLDGSDPRQSTGSQGDGSNTTFVAEDADKRALVPTGSINDNWKGGGTFGDSFWSPCIGSPGGVGYERSSGYDSFISLDVESQMYARNTSCYIRIPFTLRTSFDELNFMSLRIRYDDGFIAWLNGVEIARQNFSGTPAWNSHATASRSDALAVEPESIDVSAFLANLRQGTNILAIQGL
ncbi:MAG: CotH kinase family protein, partial [Sedimentisphaerales bacterium]